MILVTIGIIISLIFDKVNKNILHWDRGDFILKANGLNGFNNIIGVRVKEARLNMRLSQSELASRLQINNVNLEQKAISRIENGIRFVADFELLELSLILKVSAKWLLTGAD